MKKIVIILALCIIAVFLLVGCSTKESKQTPPPNSQEVSVSSDQNKAEVTLYFANKEYIQTGNESLSKVLPEKRNMALGSMPKEEAIVRELMKGPQKPNLSIIIPQNVKLNSVKIEGDIAYVDFAKENLTGGSLQESLMMTGIVQSLTELENIKKVQFLVDGKKAETLMGHFDVSQPISRMK